MHMQRYQDRPRDAATDETYHAENLQKAKEEEAIKGRMIENKGVWDLCKWFDPIEPS